MKAVHTKVNRSSQRVHCAVVGEFLGLSISLNQRKSVHYEVFKYYSTAGVGDFSCPDLPRAGVERGVYHSDA